MAPISPHSVMLGQCFRELERRKEWAEEVRRREVARLLKQNMKLEAEIEGSTDSVNSRKVKSIGPKVHGHGCQYTGADIDVRSEGIHDG